MLFNNSLLVRHTFIAFIRIIKKYKNYSCNLQNRKIKKLI